MLVVLGGTRKVEKVPLEVIDLLVKHVEKASSFYVGDAPGIDTAFQKELKKLNVKQVTVCSSADVVRNNVGNWPEKLIQSGLVSKSHARHAAKDRFMTKTANLGIMVWDTQSAGTLANVLDLVAQGKNCYLFNYLDSELIYIDSKESLDKYLGKYPEVTLEARRRNSASAKRENKLKRDMNLSTDPQLFNSNL